MATIIRPKSGKDWEDEFPRIKDEPQTLEEAKALGVVPFWYHLNSALYVVAAFYSRGTVEIKKSERARVWALNKIVTSYVNGGLDEFESDERMAELGRSIYALIKVLDTEPTTNRTFASVNRIEIESNAPAPAS